MSVASSDMGGGSRETISLGVTGDVMLGRAIDAILPHHVDGKLYEGYIRHADQYVELAVRENGPLPKQELKEKGCTYVWGDLMNELHTPDCVIVNLETAITTHDRPAPHKGINYRCHPKNVDALIDGGVKVATLANNHVLDWSAPGLEETLTTLENAGILYSGAGRNMKEATIPAISPVALDRNNESTVDVKVAAVGFPSAGVPRSWKATDKDGGVNVEEDTTSAAVGRIVRDLGVDKKHDTTKPRDVSVVSLHWGPNWGWGVPKGWRQFAHSLIDNGVDVVVGHSSHHVKGIEVYKGKMIAYGLGDFLNDYEGITGQGYELFRDDLACFYMPTINVTSGQLEQLDIIPCKIRNLRVQRATNKNDIAWLRNTLSSEGSPLGTTCEIVEDKATGLTNLRLVWK